MIMIITISLLLLFVIIGLSFLYYRKNKFDQFEIVEKDVDYDNRYFLFAVYKNGDRKLVCKEPLNEKEVIQKSLDFMNKEL